MLPRVEIEVLPPGSLALGGEAGRGATAASPQRWPTTFVALRVHCTGDESHLAVDLVDPLRVLVAKELDVDLRLQVVFDSVVIPEPVGRVVAERHVEHATGTFDGRLRGPENDPSAQTGSYRSG